MNFINGYECINAVENTLQLSFLRQRKSRQIQRLLIFIFELYVKILSQIVISFLK